MDIPAQPRVRADRRGMALPASLLGVVAIAILAAGAWVVVDLNARSAVNRESAARALHVAEAGAAHAIAVLDANLSDHTLTVLLLGSDSLPGTDDDGLLEGYGLELDDEIPADGFAWGDGTYKVSFLDDPGEGDGDDLTDRNGRILVRCTGELQSGARATVDFIYGSDPIAPAVVVDGNLSIGGSVELLGTCGGVYANGVVDVTSLVVEQSVISSDTVRVSGTIEDPDGDTVTPLVDQPIIDLPTYNLWDTCAGATYILGTDGYITTVATGARTSASSGHGAFGWVRKTVAGTTAWELVANQVVEATFCVKGNAKMDGNLGTDVDPFSITVYATGGITATGNLVIEPHHDSGYLLMAKGDLKIAGNVSGASPDLTSGILYAGSQCNLSGNPHLAAQLSCADGPDPAGAANYAPSNSISGNVQFTYACPPVGSLTRRAIAWYQRFGQ